MAQVNKSSNEVCPFMHSKWIFVVLATAWRCVIHQGTHVWMLSGWQAGYLSMLLQIFSSTAVLSLAPICLCMRAVSWLYTGRCSLQPWHLSHQQAHWTSAVLSSGLTWTDSSRATWELSLLLILFALWKLLHNMLSFTSASVRNLRRI